MAAANAPGPGGNIRVAHQHTPGGRLNVAPNTHTYERNEIRDKRGMILLEEAPPQGVPTESRTLAVLPEQNGPTRSERSYAGVWTRQKYNVPYAIASYNVSHADPHPLVRQVMPKASLNRNGRVDGYVPDVRRPGEGQW